MSQAKLGNTNGSLRKNTTHSLETRRKISLSRIGVPSPRRGVRLEEETKERIRAAARSQYGNRRYLLSNGMIFYTLKEAANYLGMTPAGVGKSVAGSGKLRTGLTIRQEDDMSDKGMRLHAELAMGKGKAEAQGKKVKMENLGTSLPKAQLKCGGKVSPKKKGKK